MSTPQAFLPAEILEQIFAHIAAFDPHHQHTLCNCTLVSRSWYANSIKFLYENPEITGKNFDPFVRAICPSVNAHVRTNGLAELVRRLDMSRLVHNGSKSLTARILGRVKGRLEDFVAPQASFAVNSLAALSKCTYLRRLDLSFVSESITMDDLLRSTSQLSKLETLHLPRSSTEVRSNDIPKNGWPVKLQELYISGGIDDSSRLYFGTLPATITRLSLGNCSRLSMISVARLLGTLKTNLRSLALLAPMTAVQVWDRPLNDVLDYAPNLTHLKISVDLIDADFFTVQSNRSTNTSLTRLDLHCLESEACEYFFLMLVYDALGMGEFAKVRIVGVHHDLGWEYSGDRGDLAEIDELLKALAREDGPEALIVEAEAGVIHVPEKSFWVWTGA